MENEYYGYDETEMNPLKLMYLKLLSEYSLEDLRLSFNYGRFCIKVVLLRIK